jgi:flagellar assembly factor FliW
MTMGNATSSATLSRPIEADASAAAVPSAAAQNAVAFPDGIPGFESCRQFVLLASDDIAPLQRLHSIEGPSANFVGIDPRLVLPTYRCRLSDHDLRVLDAQRDMTLLWLAIVTVEADGTAVANLRAPIVINPERMLGRQVLPDEGLYPIRYVLSPGA